MPIYEYSCSKCKRTIEVIQKMSDPDLKKHEGCGGALSKLFSVPGFQIKEGDWTPYRLQHPSEGQQRENEIKAKEKKKPSATMSVPPAPSRSKPASRKKS